MLLEGSKISQKSFCIGRTNVTNRQTDLPRQANVTYSNVRLKILGVAFRPEGQRPGRGIGFLERGQRALLPTS